MAEDSILQARPGIAQKLIEKAQKEAKDSAEYYFAEAVRSSLMLNCVGLDSAMHYIDEVEDYCSRLSHLSTLHHTMLTLTGHNRGLILQYKQQPDAAIANYQKVVEHSMQGLYKKWIPSIYCKIGDLYGMKNDFPLQAYFYRRGLFVADSLAIPETNKYNCYSALGFSYLSIRDFDQAGEYLAKAYRMKDSLSVQEQFLAFNNYINYYYYQRKYDQAWEYMTKVYQMIEPCKDKMPYEDALVKTNYADLAIQSGKNLNCADGFLKEAMARFEKLGMITPRHYLESMQLWLALKTNDLPKARNLVGRFEKEASDTGIEINYRKFRNSALIEYYKTTHNAEKALSILESNIGIEDSLRSDRQKKYVADLSMRYQNDITHLRQSITIGRQENKIMLLRLGIASGAIILIGLVVYFIGYLQRMKKERKYQFEQHLYEISKLKMQNIREKISPHFIFNVLNREINSHPESDTEYNRLMQLTKLLRKGLTLSGRPAISLTDELDFVTTYVSLLQDTGSHFSFRFHKDSEVDTESVQVPSMIIQTPVENAIKHGFAGMEQGGVIDLSIKKMDAGTQITVRNNGLKYTPFRPAGNNSTGTGLKVIYQTLMLMNARNKEHITFDIRENEGTEVIIYIPYIYTFNW